MTLSCSIIYHFYHPDIVVVLDLFSLTFLTRFLGTWRRVCMSGLVDMMKKLSFAREYVRANVTASL